MSFFSYILVNENIMMKTFNSKCAYFRCEGKNDKVKYLVLLCGDDEDVEVVKAAAGALAMLTSASEKVDFLIHYNYNPYLLSTYVDLRQSV